MTPSARQGSISAMQVVTGTVVDGKVVLEGGGWPEGTAVTVIAREPVSAHRLPPALQTELEQALAEADAVDGISDEELFAKLRKYD